MIGILGFSLTLPATRLAVAELDPIFVGLGRALIASIIASVALIAFKAPLPRGKQWLRLAAVALSIVIGFPLLSSWAMVSAPASHGAVVVGLVPLATALFAAILAKERPTRLFWLATIIGSLTIVVTSLSTRDVTFHYADLLLLGAVIAAGFGYAEGARLSKVLGTWQTVSWALILSTPLVVIPVFATQPSDFNAVSWQSWTGFLYVGIVSMYFAFVAWYKGLTLGGIAHIGRLQLFQPFLTIVAAALLMGETVLPLEVIAAVIVFSCIVAGRRKPVEGAQRAVADR